MREEEKKLEYLKFKEEFKIQSLNSEPLERNEKYSRNITIVHEEPSSDSMQEEESPKSKFDSFRRLSIGDISNGFYPQT